jgi:hypothetical protein
VGEEGDCRVLEEVEHRQLVALRVRDALGLAPVVVRIGLAPAGAPDERDQPVVDVRDAAEEPGNVAVEREVLDQARDVVPGADAVDARLAGLARDLIGAFH